MKIFRMLAALGVLASAVTAWAQFDPTVRDAGSKMRDEAITGHEYRAAQRSAQARSQTLYHYYAQPKPIVTKEQAKEAAVAIKKDIKEADTALAKLKKAHAKEPEVVKLIEGIEKHHAKAHEFCAMTEKELEEESAKSETMADCCSNAWHELEAAKSDTDKLFKMLNIKELEPPKKAAPAAKK
jgi:hypothetical protein